MLTTQSDRALMRESDVKVPHPGTMRMAIAALRSREIENMLREDLIDLIRLSQMIAEASRAAADVDRLGDTELRRLAFLVRRCCRNQVDAHRCQVGQPLLWQEAI